MSEGIKSYWIRIKTATQTLKKGMQITGKHMLEAWDQRTPIGPNDQNYFEKQQGLFTLQYPRETIPVPDHGRYKLHNEIDDCIVCDKCAKVCPVNCIDIEPVRATETFGKTSDGTPLRIYAAKFDIDMAKCCFCGLCTTVCPTECLTMTSEYDFSAFDFEEHNVLFSNMTPLEILEKKQAFEAFSEKKAAEKAKASAASVKPGAKPAMRPKTAALAKPKVPGATPKPKVVIKPKVQVNKTASESGTPKPKVVIKPKIQVKKEATDSSAKAKPVIRPKIPTTNTSDEKKPPRPVIKPKVPARPKIPTRKKENPEGDE
ncbi:4Fe-4S dicluster domain-containing protein [Roseivirga misakiensis]|uniref:4Fe-4S ferredoxin-type domain-containing protein n=1 Tax=Roseivirga misakiensis TaxID=1563681 RepID=A0A1E5T528_9BACT|nr:4Fe-4S dicluster domain-containing protein [Roseivirga misakiensis]OEK06478.1 hypothetical protein BFP71_02030 [Roseivirga misakiensis]